MKLIFSLIFIVFSISLMFSQSRKDTLGCKGIFQNQTLENINRAYKKRLNQPPKEPIIFGCGTAALEYSRDENCRIATYILLKYQFVSDEIKGLKKEIPNYLNLNYFWVEKEKQDRNENYFELSELETEQLQKWYLERNHANFSVVVISSEKSENQEFLQLIIRIKDKVIKKKYELFFKNKWEYKKII